MNPTFYLWSSISRASLLALAVLMGGMVEAQTATPVSLPPLRPLPSPPPQPSFQTLPLQQPSPPLQIDNAQSSLQDQRNNDPTTNSRGNASNPKPKEAPVRERNEFQDLVTSSLNQELPMFGYNLFTDTPSTFAPVDQVPAPADYILGPGDEILLRGWGQIDVNFSAVIDRSGNFYVPKVGNVSVAGLKFRDLQGVLKTAIGRNFRNFEISTSLGQLRTIPVFVVGQAAQPGRYTVSSLSTLVSAIFAAGGPTTKGSMRSVQLKRNGRVITDFDMYDLLLRGDKSKDVNLQPGDVIYFRPIGPLAAVSGSVNNPAIFELKLSASRSRPFTLQDTLVDGRGSARLGVQASQSKSQATLRDLLGLAGGLGTTASGQRAAVERIADRALRRVDEFPLDNDGLQRVIQDGDLITIQPVSLRFENAITLKGNVEKPSRYSYHPGMRISDVITSERMLVPRSYYLGKNQLTLQPKETLALQLDSSSGSSTPASEDLPASQTDIRPARSEVNWDYAVIERQQKSDLSTKLLAFNLGLAVRQRDPDQNLPLEPGDVITVFSKDDIQVPKAKQTVFVSLTGEFNAPGVYQALPNETLRHLISRIGGVTSNAYLYGASLTRVSVRQSQQRNLNEALNRLESEVTTNATLGAKRNEQPEAFAARVKGQQELVARLRQVKAKGRLVLDLEPERNRLEDLPDIPLEDGDNFYVPPQLGVVSVFGQVYNQNTFIYKPGETVNYYLNKAGGITRNADGGSAYVLRADGSVLSRQQVSGGGLFGGGGNFEATRLMPGDTLVIPEELNRADTVADLKDVAQIIFQFAVAASVVLR
ncbi:polysaccharide biosynthesis/export family protein [Anthocerotibacter panamensis]|uniref:polysaccharide biosynthesis/export family protein n=1 Tax=Anthocerotibacter panamensis TaxID=2857077 RepID=UPI001C4025F8|nr:SLBB domain-containing protein [Anthocerotibacter panamensis]